MKLFKQTETTTEAAALADEITTVRSIMDRTGATTVPSFGAPTHCPSCAEWGLVDRNSGATTANHCYLCGSEWTITRRALAIVAHDRDELCVALNAEGALFEDPARTAHPSNPSLAGHPASPGSDQRASAARTATSWHPSNPDFVPLGSAPPVRDAAPLRPRLSVVPNGDGRRASVPKTRGVFSPSPVQIVGT